MDDASEDKRETSEQSRMRLPVELEATDSRILEKAGEGPGHAYYSHRR